MVVAPPAVDRCIVEKRTRVPCSAAQLNRRARKVDANRRGRDMIRTCGRDGVAAPFDQFGDTTTIASPTPDIAAGTSSAIQRILVGTIIEEDAVPHLDDLRQARISHRVCRFDAHAVGTQERTISRRDEPSPATHRRVGQQHTSVGSRMRDGDCAAEAIVGLLDIRAYSVSSDENHGTLPQHHQAAHRPDHIGRRDRDSQPFVVWP